MTDTTDIAALREALLTKGKRNLTATEVVTIISEMDKLNDAVKHLRIEVSASDAAFLEMKRQYSTQFDRCRELSGQLEAERQRAEAAEIAAKSYKNIAEAGVKELEALREEKAKWVKYAHLASDEVDKLKGDQVPVEYQQRTKPKWDDHHPWSDWEKCSEGTYNDLVKANLEICDWIHEVRELFTAPQKPVVLPDKIPDAFYKVLYDECGGFVDCAMDTAKVWRVAKAAIEAAGGVVKSSDEL